MGDWENIKNKIVKNIALAPGTVLDGSAVFVLDIDPIKASSISGLDIQVIDYLGNTTTQSISIGDNELQPLAKEFWLIDSPPETGK